MAWTFAAVYVIVPHFSGGNSIFYGFYDGVGGSPVGALKTLFTDPGAILSALTEVQDFAYLLWLGLPLLFLFVLSPGLAAVALPQLLANGLSDFRSMTDPRYHSVAAIIPFLVAATVFGIARIGAPRRGLAAAAVLVCSATLAIFVAPWARAVGAVPLGGNAYASPDRIAALADAVALVPSDAAVAVSNSAGGHLSARRYVYSVRARECGLGRRRSAETLDGPAELADSTRHPRSSSGLVARSARPGWVKVFEREGVFVFRRAS